MSAQKRNIKPEMMEYAEGYKRFIDACKNEWEAVSYILDILKREGFKDIEDCYDAGSGLQPGDRVYAVNRGRGLCAAIIGPQDGFNVVASHIDAPILIMKEDPIFESCGFALAKLYNRGGLKHYQWPTVPLAIHGRFVDKTGAIKTCIMGEDDSDPVFYINDMSVHLSHKMRELPMKEAIRLEHLCIALGTTDEGDGFAAAAKKLMLEKLGVSERDLLSGELYVVPAAKARDVGLDRSLVAAYGHDDRICAYASLTALLEADVSGRTAICMFQDKEENGSQGNTAARSRFYRDFLEDVFELYSGGNDRHRYAKARACSWAINGDVGFINEPMDRDYLDYQNGGTAGAGVCISRYASSSEPIYIGQLCNALDSDGAVWQMSGALKDGIREGSSVGGSFSANNFNIVNMGPGVLGMHSPYELVSKYDLYMCYRAYLTVFKQKND